MLRYVGYFCFIFVLPIFLLPTPALAIYLVPFRCITTVTNQTNLYHLRVWEVSNQLLEHWLVSELQVSNVVSRLYFVNVDYSCIIQHSGTQYFELTS